MSREKSCLLDILVQSNSAVAVYDSPNLNIAFVNKAMLAIWGRTPAIIGHSFGEVFPEFTEQGFTDKLLQVWYSGQTYRATEFPADITIEGQTETKYFDFEYQAILDQDGKTYAILHTATDVTSRFFAYEMIQERDLKISFNNDLEMWTYTLSHDLRNPLSIAKMGIQYLQEEEQVPEDKNKWLDMILEAIVNIENIVNHTVQLNQARLHGYTIESISLITVIQAICEESKLLYDNAHCRFTIGELLPVHGDRGVLYQIFLNVIGNAVKYSAKERTPHVEISSEKQEGYLIYWIKDNGIGIPEADISSLFQACGRASNTQNYNGTGLGLCLVRKIMQRLGGEIQLMSKVNEGTTVKLLFPIHPITKISSRKNRRRPVTL
ncbi:PAS domain-containing protein [Sphingobacterium sp. SGG-5]|uniref:PAS domain-containing sensor histidine kinase n=1 Tax=Sphingobacterium sp. SGG-5 TaxID=2710881 RepID=UPI0013EC2A09|nr:PAS domain-containing sensor histidine kinase [Sphingobacterium sp. SGG-5]NGM61692.1 PAS domain-containing protein [Sphingobacterium sp. SGG-5]